MFNANHNLPHGLSIRPARSSDNGFIENLYRAMRDDLRMLDADDDFIDSLIEMQFRAQREGYGAQHPDAMYFIIESHGESVGRLTLAMGGSEVRIVDIAFIPAARGKGLGKGVLQALQLTAQKIPAPLSLAVLRTNAAAIHLYTSLGFRVDYRMSYPELRLLQVFIFTGVTFLFHIDCFKVGLTQKVDVSKFM